MSTLGQGTRRQLAYSFPSTQYEISMLGQDIDHYVDVAYNTLNGYILTGYNHYYDPLTGTARDIANLTKLYACGDIHWSREFNDIFPNYQSRSMAVRQTSDGGFIITGSVKLPTSSNWDILLVKTDQYANVQWYKRFIGSYGGNDEGTAVREVYDPGTGKYDGYILTGAIDNYFDYGMCENPSSQYENATLVVIRTDVNGTMQWKQIIKPSFFGCQLPTTIPDYNHYAYGHDIEQVTGANGNLINQFVITGTYASPVLYNSLGFECVALQCQPTNRHPLLMSITDNGGAGSTLNWANIYPSPVRNGITGNTVGYSVKQTAAGYAVAGTTDFVGLPVPDQDVYLLETASNGTYITSRSYNAGAIEQGKSIEVTADHYYIFGSVATAIGGFGFNWDGLATKIDRTTKNAVWTERYAQNGFGILESSLPEVDGGYSVIGTTDMFTPTNAYYFLNSISDADVSDCGACSVEGELTQHTVDPVSLFMNFSDDHVYEFTEDGDFRLTEETKHVECECQTCSSVDITFQYGYGIEDDRGHSVQETRDNGFILAGFSGTTNLVNPDIYLVKTQNTGAAQWSVTIAESSPQFDERGFSVREAFGGYVVAGDALTSADRCAYVVRTTTNGVPMWSRLFGREATGTPYDDGFRSIKLADDNNNGTFEKSDGFIAAGFSDRPAPGPASVYNGYISKIAVNSVGTNPIQSWGYTYGHDQDDYFMDIIQLDEDDDGFADDGYLAAGFSNSTFGAQPVGLGGYNVFITKVDELGNEQWSKIYGTDNDDVAYTVIQTDDDYDGQADDGFIVVGATGTINFTPELEVDELTSSTDFYVLKIASDGSLEWSYTIDQGDDAVAYSVVQSSDLSFVVGGDARLANQNMQATMFKIDRCGSQVLWGRHYPEDPTTPFNIDHARELVQTSDNGYSLFGSTCTYASPGGIGGGAAKGDFYLVKTDCLGNVCLSGTLNLLLVNPGTLEHFVDAVQGNGPDASVGSPTSLQHGVDYPICPEESEGISPVPGKDIDLSWMFNNQ